MLPPSRTRSSVSISAFRFFLLKRIFATTSVSGFFLSFFVCFFSLFSHYDLIAFDLAY